MPTRRSSRSSASRLRPGVTPWSFRGHSSRHLGRWGGELASVIRVAHVLATVVRDDLGAVGVNLRQNNGAKAGQDVFHFHLHVVPRYEDDKVGPGRVWGAPPWVPPSGGDTERRRVATAIRRGVSLRAFT